MERSREHQSELKELERDFLRFVNEHDRNVVFNAIFQAHPF